MTSQEDLKRKRRIAIGYKFIEMLFENPNNYYMESGIPEGSNFVGMYEDEAKDCIYAVYQNDDWEPLNEGEPIPVMDVNFHELNCVRCDTEMMHDEVNNEQYCPRCERRFFGRK